MPSAAGDDDPADFTPSRAFHAESAKVLDGAEQPGAMSSPRPSLDEKPLAPSSHTVESFQETELEKEAEAEAEKQI